MSQLVKFPEPQRSHLSNGQGDSSERLMGACQEAITCRFSERCGNNHHENNNNGHKEDKLSSSGKFIYVEQLIFRAGW